MSYIIFQVPLVNIVDGSSVVGASDSRQTEPVQSSYKETVTVQDIWQRIVDNDWIIGITVQNGSVR
jgi:hypothetical protein